MTPVIDLAGRLTDTQDRERYAALVSYINSLPPGDELVRLLELLGLLSLVGQRVPEAMGEFLQELRAQTAAAQDCYRLVDARLAGLPSEIATGVNVADLANRMSEVFRQQLASTALQDTAALLKLATTTIKALSADLTAALKPAAGECTAVAARLVAETTRLLTVVRQVEQHNAALLAREKSNRWLLTAVLLFLAFLLGGFAALVVENRDRVHLLKGNRITAPSALIVSKNIKGNLLRT